MKFAESAEARRDQLQTALEAAKTPEAAIRVLDGEVDRLLLAYNDACDSPRARETAAWLAGSVRAALPLLDTAGEVLAWERQAAGEKDNPYDRKTNGPDRQKAALFALFGVMLLVAAVGSGILWQTQQLGKTGFLLTFLCGVLSAMLCVLSGRAMAPKKVRTSGSKEVQYEVRRDNAKVLRVFFAVLRTMDRDLEEAVVSERWERKQMTAGEEVLSPAELMLFGGLLEAAASGDGDYALEQAEEVRHFLHRKGVELVDYSPEERDRFDLLPGSETATLCPAMVYEGRTIRKGIATV